MSLIIFERVLTHYRLDFYNYLSEFHNQDIVFLTGKFENKNGFHTQKNKANFQIIEMKCVKIFGFEFYDWPSSFLNKDNVIVSVLSFAAISNLKYALVAKRKGIKFYWWGHSRNFSKNNFINFVKDKIKILVAKSGTGFLVYTKGEEEILINDGFNPKKIIALNNTLNTVKINSIIKKISADEIFNTKRNLELNGFITIGLIGRLYKLRNSERAIKAINIINQDKIRAKLLIIGDGPDFKPLSTKYKKNSDIIFLGAIEDQVKLAPFMLSIDFFVNPGLIGLNLVHSMAYGKTSVLVNQKIHSPELYYLENNINGLMSEDNLEDFIEKITLLINDTSILNKLNTNAKTYVTNNLTIENMANNFLNILK